MFGFRKRRRVEEVKPDSASNELDAETSGVQALNTLRNFEKMHRLDPNLPIDELNEVDAIIAGGDAEKGVEAEQVLVEDNSPYPEVCGEQ